MIYSYKEIESRQKYSKIDPALLKKGIYKIVNAVNNKFYIGSTTRSFITRFKNHTENLFRNAHTNPHLQASFNKYGKDSLYFYIVEFVEEDNLIKEKEQIFIDLFYNVLTCYNISKDSSAPMRGRKHTKETLEKMSKISKARGKEIGEITRKHRLGSKHPKETIEKFKIAARNRDDSKRIN